MSDLENFTCPVPLFSGDRIVLAHGGGGKLTQQLIERVFLPAFRNPALEARHDGAVLASQPEGCAAGRLAFTTDAYVVRPIVFPGGNIGDLAVNGTVNDLAMCGACPRWLSVAFILEEGLEVAALCAVVESMRKAAAAAGVELVTGDTKVVDRGSADNLFITTAGIGTVECEVGPRFIEPGDAVVVSGDLGRHGVAVLSVREGLEFEAPVESDCAALWEPVKALFDAGVPVHCLRDLTRGGLASALNELAAARGVRITIEEAAVPVGEVVKAACELLGLDPLYVANEGRFCAFVPARDAERAVDVLRGVAVSRGAAHIGHVVEGRPQVVMESRIGGTRVVDMLSGEQLPRIC